MTIFHPLCPGMGKGDVVILYTKWSACIPSADRGARGEALRRVHECVFGVFGVLALESEPVDPRL
jgi:hypothetical protein